MKKISRKEIAVSLGSLILASMLFSGKMNAVQVDEQIVESQVTVESSQITTKSSDMTIEEETQSSEVGVETTNNSDSDITVIDDETANNADVKLQSTKVANIVNLEYTKKDLVFEKPDYSLGSRPGNTEGYTKLGDSKDYLNKYVQGIAIVTTSDNEKHVNYKLGDRYYWTNIKAFKEFPTVIEKIAIKEEVKIVNDQHDFYNVPENTFGANTLLDTTKVLNKYVTAVAMYKTSDGEYHYNFKYGERYYWANVKIFEKAIIVVEKQPANQSLKVIDSKYNFFNVPENTPNNVQLELSSKHKGKYVTGVAKYKTSDGEYHYNFKLGNRYYWANSKAFEEMITVVEKKAANFHAQFTSGDYDLYNTPEKTANSTKLLNGKEQIGNKVQIVAQYKTSDGEYHYNFKLGNRYYWSNSKNFTRINQVVKKEYVNFLAKFDMGNQKLYNVPYKTDVNIKEFGSTQTYIGTDVRINAIFTTDDGEKHYNYKLGDRYYWTNAKAFFKYKEVVSTKYINYKAIISKNNYGLHNVPYGTPGAVTLGYTNSYIGTKVDVVAERRLNDGSIFYNYKLGNRYYWTDTKAFSPAITGNKIWDTAYKYVGITSYPSRSNMFTKAYWGQGFNGSPSAQYDWCSVFLWYVFREQGVQSAFYNGSRSNDSFYTQYPERYPETVRQWQIGQGNYFTDKNKLKKGDLIFYDWKRPIRTAEHIGLFGGFDAAGNMLVIDGNWGDGVRIRTIFPTELYGMASIMGYASPY